MYEFKGRHTGARPSSLLLILVCAVVWDLKRVTSLAMLTAQHAQTNSGADRIGGGTGLQTVPCSLAWENLSKADYVFL